MKLNKEMKSAIADRIMKDVPRKLGKQQIQELMQKELDAHLKVVLSAKILALWHDPEARPYIKTCSVGALELVTYHERHQLNMAIEHEALHRLCVTHPCLEGVKKEMPESRQLVLDYMKECQQRLDMHHQLMANFTRCNTAATLVKYFPEFEKYLPMEAAPVLLPATDNLVASLSKMGWPAGAQPAAA